MYLIIEKHLVWHKHRRNLHVSSDSGSLPFLRITSLGELEELEFDEFESFVSSKVTTSMSSLPWLLSGNKTLSLLLIVGEQWSSSFWSV